MNKNKVIGIAIWALGFVLAMVLMFCLKKGLTPTFWITFAFVIVGFASAMIFQMLVWKNNDTLDNQYIHIPAMMVSSGYVLVQIPISVIFSLGSSSIPVKTAILVNATLFIVAWIINLMSVAGNDHIRRVNGRQKDHHTEL